MTMTLYCICTLNDNDCRRQCYKAPILTTMVNQQLQICLDLQSTTSFDHSSMDFANVYKNSLKKDQELYLIHKLEK